MSEEYNGFRIARDRGGKLVAALELEVPVLTYDSSRRVHILTPEHVFSERKLAYRVAELEINSVDASLSRCALSALRAWKDRVSIGVGTGPRIGGQEGPRVGCLCR